MSASSRWLRPSVSVAGRSDIGRRRRTNEDAFLTDSTSGLFLIADGMGGQNAGEVASRIVVETIGEFVRSSRSDRNITWPYGLDPARTFEANQIWNAVRLANQQVWYEAKKDPSRHGMGSTVVVAIVGGGRVVHTSVGDSRLYLLGRDAVLRQLSVDHSWAASMLKAGADPQAVKDHPMRHMLTRALGIGEEVEFEVEDRPLSDGDVLLMCSDGLHGSVGEDAIARVLADRAVDLDAQAQRLIDLANEAGGPDNVTVVIIHANNAPSTANS